MHSREELQVFLEQIAGSRNVYYQLPSNVLMNYPAIRYEHSSNKNVYANNGIYLQTNIYKVTVIDKSPESEITKKLSKLVNATFNAHYVADGLNHDVFTLYY